ncbi:hypothetical protein Cni_G06226 [Canna indica]|uniref:Uncharacterized protein n=1 Tax=Canna indica TaxID=4628 RepID=A0AAQ3JWM7_9LILI|nr:hypothetical protein Cni_G06226 [Canna indica]
MLQLEAWRDQPLRKKKTNFSPSRQVSSTPRPEKDATPKTSEVEVARHLDAGPFANHIMATHLTPRSKLPTILTPYDDTGVPALHLTAFRTMLLYHGATDFALCRAFPILLEKLTYYGSPPSRRDQFTPSTTFPMSSFSDSPHRGYITKQEQPYTISGRGNMNP